MAETSYGDVARQIVEIVGKDNIVSAAHCATRLRLIVRDKDKIDTDKIESVPMVKGTFFNAGQYQIILGTGIVNKVFAEIENMGLSTASKAEQAEAVNEQQTGVKRMMRMLGDIFVPIIPVIAATGLFLGLKGCLFNDNVLGLFGASSAMIPDYVVTLVNVLTETAFSFLPAIVCWSAFKVFGGMPVIGLVLGLMLVSPFLPNAYSVADPKSGVEAVMAFGFIPVVGCQGSILTAIVTAFIGANLEKRLRRVMPNALDLIMTPFIVMLVTFLVIILGIGPIMHNIELGLVSIVETLVKLPFGIGGFIIGATYPLLVITGLHHTYTMIETSLLANTGFNPVITLCAMYGFANVGTCLAFFVKSKRDSVKSTSIGAMLSQLFGISEPVLFGLDLRWNLRPLVIMLLTSGLGAAALSILHVQSNSYGLAVLPSYLMYIYDPAQLVSYLIVSICSVALCFVLTYLFGVPREAISEKTDGAPVVAAAVAATASDAETAAVLSAAAAEAAVAAANPETKEIVHAETIAAPMRGDAIAMSEVPDPVFAGGVMGQGAAIVPSEGKLFAPVSGTVTVLAQTGHAVGIVSDAGCELLMHVGIDTVTLEGKPFAAHVAVGDHVERGQLLLDIDLDAIKAAGLSPVTPVIVANTAAFDTVEPHVGTPVAPGDPLIDVR